MSAYRDATLTPPVDTTPPLRDRMLYALDRAAACQRWQWARRESGGRWAQVVHSLGGGAFALLWWNVKHCPLTWERHSERNNLTIRTVTSNDHNATIDQHRSTVDEHGRCGCEVWP